MSEATAWSRREALAGLGLLAIAGGGVHAVETGGANAGAAPAPRSSEPVAVPADVFADFMRMRTSPDGRPVLWVYAGVLVVKPEGEVARPLARIEGLSRSVAVAQPDGSYLWTLDEAGYYCDPVTGAVASTLFNPFIGKDVVPKHYRSPQTLRFSRNGVLPGRELPPGIDFHGEITRLAELAGTVALTEDLYVRMGGTAATADRPARPTRFANSLATFTTLRRNLQRPAGQWVDCQFNYTTLNTFVDWLGLAGRPGVQDMRLVGLKCRLDDRAAVPRGLRERIEREHPDLLKGSEGT
jgi:hypothetical protein